MPSNQHVAVTVRPYANNNNYVNFRAVKAGMVYEDVLYVGTQTEPCQQKALVRSALQWLDPVGYEDYDDYDENYDDYDEDDEDEYCDCGCMDDDDDY